MGTLYSLTDIDISWHFPVTRRRRSERSRYHTYVDGHETLILTHPHVIYFHIDDIANDASEKHRRLRREIRRFVELNVEHEAYYRKIDLRFRYWWKADIDPDHFSARHSDWSEKDHGYWAFYFEEVSVATAIKLQHQEKTTSYELVPEDFRKYTIDHRWWDKQWNPDDELIPIDE